MVPEGRNGWSQLGSLLLSPCCNPVVLDHFCCHFLNSESRSQPVAPLAMKPSCTDTTKPGRCWHCLLGVLQGLLCSSAPVCQQLWGRNLCHSSLGFLGGSRLLFAFTLYLHFAWKEFGLPGKEPLDFKTTYNEG